jgi:uncharacterized membrane protein
MVATLPVWRFPGPDDAQRAVSTLESLQSQELIKIHDAAIVEWRDGKKKPKTRQLHSLAGAGALGGAFWGMLFGLLGELVRHHPAALLNLAPAAD